MSYYLNHKQASIDAGRLGGDPREVPPACTCPPNGNGIGEMCPACQAEYRAWREQMDAELPLPGTEYERCGQQFSDGPLPDDVPF